MFTYRIPPELGAVEPGRRVLVPLGRRTETGVVLGPGAEQSSVRDAVRLLDAAPLLTGEVIALVKWAAAHYLAPLGPAVKATLPPGLDVRDTLTPRLTAAGRAALEQGQLDLPGQEEALRRALRKASSGARLSRAQLATLSRRGLVELVRQESPARIGAQLVEVAQAAPGASVDAVKRAPQIGRAHV